jgi:hypothetical protein
MDQGDMHPITVHVEGNNPKRNFSYYFWSKEYLHWIVYRREHKLQYSCAPGVVQFRWKLDSEIR